jgi:hypothetical protein
MIPKKRTTLTKSRGRLNSQQKTTLADSITRLELREPVSSGENASIPVSYAAALYMDRAGIEEPLDCELYGRKREISTVNKVSGMTLIRRQKLNSWWQVLNSDLASIDEASGNS